MTDSKQPEALRLADELEDGDFYESHSRPVYGWNKDAPCDDAALELRRQHAEIERLQAERDALLSALQGMNEAYCRAGFSLTKAERYEDIMRLMTARAAISTATGAAA